MSRQPLAAACQLLRLAVVGLLITLPALAQRANRATLQVPRAPSEPLRLRGAAVARLSQPAAARSLTVYVVDDGRKATLPVQGRCIRRGDLLEFVPAFPFAAGVQYEVGFGAGLAGAQGAPRTFTIPLRTARPVPVVRALYPSADVLPENTLRFYLCFSEPMRRQVSRQYLQLRDEAGHEVAEPFINFEQELWSPDGRRLTLLLDPSRIKRGVTHAAPGLQAGSRYELLIASGWPSARGMPMVEGFRKLFRVDLAERRPLTAANWTVTEAPGPVVCIQFDRPLDYALLENRLAVSDAHGRPVPGTSRTGTGERSWQFRPAASRPGPYLVTLAPDLEDVCGNRLGEALDHELSNEVQQLKPRQLAVLPAAAATP